MSGTVPAPVALLGDTPPRSSGDPGLTCSEVTAVPGLASPQAFPRAAASTGAAMVWGRGAKALAAGRVAPLWHRQSWGQGGAHTLGPGSRSPSPPSKLTLREGLPIRLRPRVSF